MTYILGTNLYDGTPKNQMLRRELVKAGLKNLKQVERAEELEGKGDGYCLIFGAAALSQACAVAPITELRGQMHSCIHNEEMLCFATLSPGMVFRDRRNLPLLRDDLKLFATVIRLDEKGVLP